MPSSVIPAEIESSVEYLAEVVKSQGHDDEMVVVLLRELADLIKKRQSRGGALSEEQVAFLIESGTFTEEEFAETTASLERGDLAKAERETRLEPIAASQSTAEVALRLGISASLVNQRRARGNLYAFIAGGKHRYPNWQFSNDYRYPVVPRLKMVVNAFPKDMHPASIQGLMSTAQEDLVINSQNVTPVEWLLRGGDSQAIVDILDSFLQS